MSNPHTPTPLVSTFDPVCKRTRIDRLTDGPNTIEHICTVKNAEFAAYIVKAVNCHSDLRDALGLLLARLSEFGNIDILHDEGPIEDAKAALAKAGVK